MAETKPKPVPRKRAASPPSEPRHGPGPTDFADPLLRAEVRKAMVWIGLASLVAAFLTIWSLTP